MRHRDPFVGMFTLKRVLGPSSQRLRLYHRVALRIHERLPTADITGIADAVVFGDYIGADETQLLEAALEWLEREPLGYLAAHPRGRDPISLERAVLRATRGLPKN